MNLIRQLGFLRLNVGSAPSLEADGRVLHLFRNRAELKKAYGDLQNEIHLLKDRVKQQEGATARVQEMLEELESRLADPASGHQALVFYQLRDLWNCGRDLIRVMIGELSAQHEERERRIFLSEFNRQQFERRQAVEHDLNAAQIAASDVRMKLSELQKARVRADRWWHYFRRRELERKISMMSAEATGANATLAEARAAFDTVANVQAPDFPGLSVDARRDVNLAAIAYAQVLALRLVRTPLLAMAGEACRRRAPVQDYGDQAACLTLMAHIARAKLALAGRGSASTEVRQRSERLKTGARYRTEEDTVPADDSIAMAQPPPAAGPLSGVPAELPAPQVLRDDLWDLRRLLLR